MAKDHEKPLTMSEAERHLQEMDLRRKFEGLEVSQFTVGELVQILTLFGSDLAVVNKARKDREEDIKELKHLLTNKPTDQK